MIKAGNLRDRITIQRREHTADGFGNEQTGNPVDIGTIWADVLERLGGEKLASGAVMETRMATIRIRHSAFALSIVPSDIVVARGDVWNIRSIAAVGRKNELIELLCEFGAAS